MRASIELVLVAALGVAACKQSATTVAMTGSGTDSAQSASTASPPAAPPSVDAAAGPCQRPATATSVSGDADATALGSAVVVHLVEHIVKPKPTDTERVMKSLLVLEGGGKAIVADVTAEDLGTDGSPAAMAITTESDIVHAPLTPPRPFQESDAHLPLDFKAPLVFIVHVTAKNETRDVAVGNDQDSIVVWTLVTPSDSVDVAPEWERSATIKLAPGAAVTPAGS